MKRLLLLTLFALFFCHQSVLATEVEVKQNIANVQSYAVLNLQKASPSENTQSIKNNSSWFCINIIVNGKVKDEKKSN